MRGSQRGHRRRLRSRPRLPAPRRPHAARRHRGQRPRRDRPPGRSAAQGRGVGISGDVAPDVCFMESIEFRRKHAASRGLLLPLPLAGEGRGRGPRRRGDRSAVQGRDSASPSLPSRASGGGAMGEGGDGAARQSFNGTQVMKFRTFPTVYEASVPGHRGIDLRRSMCRRPRCRRTCAATADCPSSANWT